MKKRYSTNKAGYTLIEMLYYGAILAIVVNLAAGAFISSSRLFAYSTKALDRMQVLDEIGRDFAATVRKSSGVSEGVMNYRSGSDQVVLEVGDEYIVFGRLGDKPQLNRLVIAEEDGDYQVKAIESYRRELEDIEFIYDASPTNARLVSLSLVPGNDGRKNKAVPQKFSAAIRGR